MVFPLSFGLSLFDNVEIFDINWLFHYVLRYECYLISSFFCMLIILRENFALYFGICSINYCHCVFTELWIVYMFGMWLAEVHPSSMHKTELLIFILLDAEVCIFVGDYDCCCMTAIYNHICCFCKCNVISFLSFTSETAKIELKDINIAFVVLFWAVLLK